MLTIDCPDRFTDCLDEQLLSRLAEAVLTAEGYSNEAEISLLVTDDEGIRALNRQYRGMDTPTDVLSFSLLPETDDGFVSPAEAVPQLGDIVISCERAAAQAEEMGHSLCQEVAELFVHGLLHILGYDHEEAEAARLMADKADAVLAQVAP